MVSTVLFENTLEIFNSKLIAKLCYFVLFFSEVLAIEHNNLVLKLQMLYKQLEKSPFIL